MIVSRGICLIEAADVDADLVLWAANTSVLTPALVSVVLIQQLTVSTWTGPYGFLWLTSSTSKLVAVPRPVSGTVFVSRTPLNILQSTN